VQSRRITYSARATDIRSNVSLYIPPADNQNLVLQAAQRQIDARREKASVEKSKYYTVDRVFNLWFGQSADQAPGETPLIPPTNDMPSPTE
jgi:hypothetical protein